MSTMLGTTDFSAKKKKIQLVFSQQKLNLHAKEKCYVWFIRENVVYLYQMLCLLNFF